MTGHSNGSVVVDADTDTNAINQCAFAPATCKHPHTCREDSAQRRPEATLIG